MTEGDLAPGLEIGACRDTGGSWSPYFLAHASQLVRIPDAVTDENALLLEPFATSLHAVLTNLPRDEDTVLIIGAGAIGLGVIAALRAVGSRAKIIVLARHTVQQELAQRFGADIVIPSSPGARYFQELADTVGGKLLKPIIGKPVLLGGVDLVYECVGQSDTIDDALRLTRAGGRVVIAGLASVPKNVDWTPIWMKELNIQGTFTYGYDRFEGRRWRTFDLAVDLLERGRVNLAPIITHKFALRDYARAFQMLGDRRHSQVVKAVFEF